MRRAGGARFTQHLPPQDKHLVALTNLPLNQSQPLFPEIP